MDSNADYRKRRIKEAIYLNMKNSINEHNNIDTA